MKQHILIVAYTLLLTSCVHQPAEHHKVAVSATLPVEKYFIEQLSDTTISVNVVIPQNVGHSEYSPRPSQMMSLAQSEAYFAIGNLDFEIAWKDRLTNNNKMVWTDLSKDIELIHTDAANHEHHHDTDPHYWLSPKRAKIMARNMATELRQLTTYNVDSALSVLNANLDSLDKQLSQLSGKTFMIYHPALTYMAADYGLTQLEIEKDGNAPSPLSYKNSIESGKANNVKVVFVQQGYDIEKAQTAAQMLNAKVVSISPEGYNWPQTMQTIIEALAE